MKKVLLLACLALTLTVTGCSGPSVKTVRDTERTESSVVLTDKIKIQNGQMIPDKIQINQGTKVSFINQDKTPQIIASDPHPEHNQLPDLFSPPIYQEKTYSYVFASEGNYGVHLEDNPSIKAQIIVVSSGGEINNVNK